MGGPPGVLTLHHRPLPSWRGGHSESRSAPTMGMAATASHRAGPPRSRATRHRTPSIHDLRQGCRTCFERPLLDGGRAVGFVNPICTSSGSKHESDMRRALPLRRRRPDVFLTRVGTPVSGTIPSTSPFERLDMSSTCLGIHDVSSLLARRRTTPRSRGESRPRRQRRSNSMGVTQVRGISTTRCLERRRPASRSSSRSTASVVPQRIPRYPSGPQFDDPPASASNGCDPRSSKIRTCVFAR